MMEEPEAHVFPYFIDLLAEFLEEALRDAPKLKVLIVTHNPLLVYYITRKIDKSSIYYAHKQDGKYTKFDKVNLYKMGEEIFTFDDLMLYSFKELKKRGIIE
jgi:predicted ATPase